MQIQLKLWRSPTGEAWKTYLAMLAILAIGSVALSYYFGKAGRPWLSSLASNMGAAIVGGLLAVAFFDRLVRPAEERRRTRRKTSGYPRLKSVVLDYLANTAAHALTLEEGLKNPLSFNRDQLLDALAAINEQAELVREEVQKVIAAAQNEPADELLILLEETEKIRLRGYIDYYTQLGNEEVRQVYLEALAGLIKKQRELYENILKLTLRDTGK
ncbi:MAG TPA: hypothetical protein PKA10_01685 [Selenomonadales bacterium]|nr:hypothetical protein [Selenomonadales bacterium]